MQSIYRKLKDLFINGWAWVLDYAYVMFWQVYAFFVRSKSSRYTTIKTNSYTQKTPIILIPGIYENWRFMKPVADMLHKRGYEIHVISELGYNTGEIEKMALVVENYIEAHSLKKYIIVAHSKGGLVGKFLMMQQSNYESLGMIAINTPFIGSRYATLIPLKSVRIFLPNSPTLSSLMTNTLVNKKIVSIYGVFDPHIPEGSFLDGATNIQLPTRGHFKIMRDARVHETILKSIDILTNQLPSQQ
jgi:triacylglycerol lipase